MSKFKTAIIDPPWPYGKGTGTFQGTPDNSDSDQKQYEVMTMADIKNLPIKELDLDYVFLWVGSVFLPDALDLLNAWGTPYCTQLLWYKGGTGSVGTWFRSGHEACLIGRRQGENALSPYHETVLFGHRKGAEVIRSTQATAFEHKRLPHSEKPDTLHRFIEGVGTEGKHKKDKNKEKTPCAYPGAYLEIFGRRTRTGWTVIGNESPETKGEHVRVSLENIIEGQANQ